MKSMALNIVLVALCVVLAGLLYVQKKRSTEQEIKTVASVSNLSNDLVKTSSDLLLEKNEKSQLQTNLADTIEQVLTISNELTTVTEKLTMVEAEAAEAKASVETAKQEMARREAKITDLESQREDLSHRMGDLTNSITGLERQILDTENKLAASEGDRAFLYKELKRLQAEKSELEKQLNSLAFLREQVHKLREELSIQRRLDWIRRGILSGGSGVKGAERLQALPAKPTAQTNFNLNVELRQDGTVRVAPADTNAPPSSTNAPALNK